MKATKFGKNFFESTRGQVLKLLRRGVNTVEDLSTELDVTDNAVRAHLTTLERDGLVERRGLQPGTRKPHFNYELSADAEELFPKAYPALLNHLLAVLKQKMKPEELETLFMETARTLAENNLPDRDETVENRVQKAIQALEAMGGASGFEEEDERYFIRCITKCPFDKTVSEHPEVCGLTEKFVSEVTGLKVEEHCRKSGVPKCLFEIKS